MDLIGFNSILYLCYIVATKITKYFVTVEVRVVAIIHAAQTDIIQVDTAESAAKRLDKGLMQSLDTDHMQSIDTDQKESLDTEEKSPDTGQEESQDTGLRVSLDTG